MKITLGIIQRLQISVNHSKTAYSTMHFCSVCSRWLGHSSSADRDRILRQGCQMAIARFLDPMCLALRASALWLRYATLQNLFPSFPWIAPPPRPPPWRNPRKGRNQILPSGNLGGSSDHGCGHQPGRAGQRRRLDARLPQLHHGTDRDGEICKSQIKSCLRHIH